MSDRTMMHTLLAAIFAAGALVVRIMNEPGSLLGPTFATIAALGALTFAVLAMLSRHQDQSDKRLGGEAEAHR